MQKTCMTYAKGNYAVILILLTKELAVMWLQSSNDVLLSISDLILTQAILVFPQPRDSCMLPLCKP